MASEVKIFSQQNLQFSLSIANFSHWLEMERENGLAIENYNEIIANSNLWAASKEDEGAQKSMKPQLPLSFTFSFHSEPNKPD